MILTAEYNSNTMPPHTIITSSIHHIHVPVSFLRSPSMRCLWTGGVKAASDSAGFLTQLNDKFIKINNSRSREN